MSAPHPVLKKYYERESDRRPFVSALFDSAAQHYDWVNTLGSMGSGRFYRRWILAKYGLRAGMLREGRAGHSALLVQGTVEQLPFCRDRFDFLSMGYALRHVADLQVAFAECLRVLKPGGRLLILEISRPRSAVGLGLARGYFQKLLPLAMRCLTRSAQAERLMKYHWDTIAACVPPEAILEVLRKTGFVEVGWRARGGVLGEYRAVKPVLNA